MTWKKVVASVLAATLAFALAGCGSDKKEDKAAGDGDKVHLTVFAAASMTETMNQIAAQYQKEHPDVEISFNFDSSGTLKTQIQNGADCDLFISAAQKQMNQLDASKDAKANPDKLDFVKSGSRIDLLENKVVLVTPEGNPKGVQYSHRSLVLHSLSGNQPDGLAIAARHINIFYGLRTKAKTRRSFKHNLVLVGLSKDG